MHFFFSVSHFTISEIRMPLCWCLGRCQSFKDLTFAILVFHKIILGLRIGILGLMKQGTVYACCRIQSGNGYNLCDSVIL